MSKNKRKRSEVEGSVSIVEGSAAITSKATAKSSNWQLLKQKLVTTEGRVDSDKPSRKKRRRELQVAVQHNHETIQKEANKKPVFDVNNCNDAHVDKSKYVALDCEMVGLGENGKKSALARCAIVDYDGNVIFDEFVRPPGQVTDFRTKYSGIRKKDLRTGVAISLQECQQRVDSIIKGKILVGHALKNDLDVLLLKHPRQMIRDTATFKPFMRPHGKKGGKFKPRSLKDLTKQFLGYEIQSGEHDPGEDARAPMMLYRFKRVEWERSLAQGSRKTHEGIISSKKAVGHPDAKGASPHTFNTINKARPSQMFGTA